MTKKVRPKCVEVIDLPLNSMLPNFFSLALMSFAFMSFALMSFALMSFALVSFFFIS